MRYLLLTLLLISGCQKGPEAPKKEVIPMESVPPAILKTARNKLPNIQFDSARKTDSGAYEIRGKAQNGKIREVEISPSGEVIEVE